MLTDDNKMYVAQRDITVYKYLTYRKYGFFRTELYTAVQKMHVGSLFDIKGKEIKPKKRYNPDILKRDIEVNHLAVVGEGLIHAYTVVPEDLWDITVPVIIAKAVIPKGAYYVQGWGNVVAAEKIVIKKIPWGKVIRKIFLEPARLWFSQNF